MYGTGVPGPVARMLPAGRATMRVLLTEHLQLAEQRGSTKHVEAVRRELRRYGG
jgi:hypothetical protein